MSPIGIVFSALLSCIPYPPELELENFRNTILSIPEKWRDEAVVMLYDSLDITVVAVEGNNSLRYTSTYLYYINKRNPTTLEQLVFTEYANIEKVPQIQITALYPDGQAWKSTPMDFAISPTVYQGIYTSDDKLHSISIPRYVQGMILRVVEQRVYNAPEHVGHEFLRCKVPVLKKWIRLSHPLDYTIRYLVSNNENIPVQTDRGDSAGMVSYNISADTLAPIESENRLKHPEQWYAALHFSIPPVGKESYTWRRLGDYYLSCITPAMQSSPSIAELAAAIHATGRDSIIAEAFRLLQHHIRYYANFENSHSFIPRPAPEVMSNGYGDCKEMATLLKVLLSHKGVQSRLALVSTEGVTQCLDDIPTLGNFNHIILYCQDSDSTLRFFDPTISYGTAANSYFHLVGQNAFLLDSNRSRLVGIGPGDHYVNIITTSSKILKSQQSGKWQLSGTISLKGNAAYEIAPLLEDMQGEEVSSFLNTFLQDGFGLDPIAGSISFQSSDRIDMIFTAHFQSNYLAMDKGGFLLDKPSLFGGDVRYTTLDYEGPRFFAGYEQYDTWDVPAGFSDLEKNDLQHTIARGSWTRHGQQIKRAYVLQVIEIPYDRRDEVQEFYEQKKKFVKATAWK